MLAGTCCDAVEQARTILFMVSDAAPYMIGQNIVVDGGFTKNYAFLAGGKKQTDGGIKETLASKNENFKQ